MTIMPDFDVEAVIKSSPYAKFQGPWMSDDAATLTMLLIKKSDDISNATAEQILHLVEIVARQKRSNQRHFQYETTGVSGKMMGRAGQIELVQGSERYYHSPNVKGLYEYKDLPPTKDIEKKALHLVNRTLNKRRYKGAPITSVRRISSDYHIAKELAFQLERPEGGGLYEETGGFDHKPADILMEEATNVAKTIISRWASRFDIQGRIAGAEAWARSCVKDIEGMDFKEVLTPEHVKYNDDNTIERMYLTCSFEVVGHRLVKDTVKSIAHSYDDLKKLIAQHKKNAKKLEGVADVRDGRRIEKILANAIRIQMAKYGKIMLEEIELVLDGKRPNSKYPIKRTISSFYMRDGILHAPIKVGKKVKYNQGRVSAFEIKTLPNTVMTAMPGMKVRDIIDHPYLEGLVVKSVTLAGGLNIRPEANTEPLAPLLEELRKHGGPND